MTEQPSLKYREATEEELISTNPATPIKLDRRIRLSCPTGIVIASTIEFEDGERLRNVLRAVISLEAPVMVGPDKTVGKGKALVYVTRFNNEIGKTVHSYAEALVG